jgi:hypothetical protein
MFGRRLVAIFCGLVAILKYQYRVKIIFHKIFEFVFIDTFLSFWGINFFFKNLAYVGDKEYKNNKKK